MQNPHQEQNHLPHAGITSSCVTFVWSSNRKIGKTILLFSFCHPCCSGVHALTRFPCSKSLLCSCPEHIPHPNKLCRSDQSHLCLHCSVLLKIGISKEKGLGHCLPALQDSSEQEGAEQFCLSSKARLCLSSLLSATNSCQPFTHWKRCYQR